MSIPDDYEIIKVSSTDLSVKIYVSWAFDGVDELNVWYQDIITGVTYYSELGDFTVTSDEDGGGVFILVENNQPNTINISVARETPQTQTYSLNNTESLNPVALIEALDKAIKLIQEVSLGYDEQAITSINPFVIPDKVTRAGKVQTYDENGDPSFSTIDDALQDPIDYAEEWANKAEDILVSASAGGDQIDDYSALHHAFKAAASAVLASASAAAAAVAKDLAETAEAGAVSAKDDAETAQGLAEDAQAAAEGAVVPATETIAGIVERATQGEVNDGDDSTRYITAQTLLNRKVGKVAIYQDQKADGTDGGSSVSGLQIRTLNTEVSDIKALGTLSGNKVTLIEGIYLIEGYAHAYQSGKHQCSIYKNNSFIAAAVNSNNQSGGDDASTISLVQTVSTSNGSDFIELRHRIDSAKATDGLGIALSTGSEKEVYASLKFTKIG